MNNPIKWVPLLKTIYSGNEAKCPYCNGKVTHRFFAEKQVGYAQFKCLECGEEAHLSRVKFPNNTETEII